MEGPRPSTTALGASSTIAEFAAWWLNTVAAVRVRPSSLGKYVDRVERITAWLGDVRIGSLRPEQVATWQSELLSSLSAKTVADTRATFRSVVAEAVNLGLIPTNPVDRVRPPKTRASARRALTAAEARAVVAAGAEDRLGAAIALLFVQGCIATDQFSSVVDSGRCCGRTAESSFPITNAWDLTGPGTARRSKNGTASFRTRMPIHRAVTNGTMKLGDGGVHGERAGQLIPGTWCARWMGRADRVSLRDG
jgi:hypothetical protein